MPPSSPDRITRVASGGRKAVLGVLVLILGLCIAAGWWISSSVDTAVTAQHRSERALARADRSIASAKQLVARANKADRKTQRVDDKAEEARVVVRRVVSFLRGERGLPLSLIHI